MLDPLGAPLHGLFVVLGTAVAVAVLAAGARARRRLDEDMLLIVACGLLGGAIGSKLAVLWRYLDTPAIPHTLAALLVSGGQSILGGLTGAYLGVTLTKRLLGYRQDTGDLFAPAVALGIGIGRIGCWLTEVPGAPTGRSWGVVVDAARAARIAGFPAAWIGVPLHPSFLYEIPFHFAMAAWLFRLRARGAYRDRLFKLYCLAYAPFRFLIEFVRGNPPVWHGLTRSQLFLAPSIVLLAIAFFRRHPVAAARSARSVPSAPPAPPMPPIGSSPPAALRSPADA